MTTWLSHIRRAKQPKVRYGKLVIFGPNKDWEAELPEQELWDHLDSVARKPIISRMANYYGAIFGVTLATGFFYGAIQVLGVPFLMAIIVAVILGVIVGGVSGWYAGGRFNPVPEWWISSEYRPEIGERISSPWMHSRLFKAEWRRQWEEYMKVNSENKNRLPLPQTNSFSAQTLYQKAQMVDEREDLKAGLTALEKLQIGSMLAIAISLPVILIFFILGTQGGGG